ncbi:hypothetical protein GCM10011343_26250 [Flavobacterium orientale]|uniref:Outer membrane protein beta-barrel domain-containing protein n=2 Tax=Flavobacterium orientale TaxID=1756020 RepID=A0A917DH58_9FLAO|nr:hypothetical protein GCM10011343_26250 [Flavobacterium orientale]
MLAQPRYTPYNQFSLEGGYGVSIPTRIVSEVSDKSFVSVTHIALGARYMFNQDWGVKGQLAFDRFSESADLGTSFFRMDAQAYYNLGRQLGLPYATNELMGLYAHGGLGVSFARSLFNDSREHNGNILIGLTPMFKLSDKLALPITLSYTHTIKQHFSFDGIPFDPPTVAYRNGGHYTFSVGLIIYLGEERMHADWY